MHKKPRGNIFSASYVNALEEISRAIIDDATADYKNPDKRLWPIRTENYRKLSEILSSPAESNTQKESP